MLFAIFFWFSEYSAITRLLGEHLENQNKQQPAVNLKTSSVTIIIGFKHKYCVTLNQSPVIQNLTKLIRCSFAETFKTFTNKN